MHMKLRRYFKELGVRFRRWRKENLIGRNKVKKIALNMTEDRADVLVKRETDGDGGWNPKF